MNTNKALSVSQLNNYVKLLMDGDDVLNNVALRGEISNLKVHSSGHIYFTMKDERSEISAVMFKGAAERLTFKPQTGMKVVAYGRVSVYEAAGKYQIYVSAMTNDGQGALYEEFKRLYAKLSAEGLFDKEKKRELPKFPKRIGIVTSPTGAAIRDMINVTGRRYPQAEILLCPSAVQGAEAPPQLLYALELLNAIGECDVIIIGRGGGSAEDLWAFNDEALVRAVANSKTPIISAVGHEIDYTLCDYAADKRAPTPSAAAELAVPDITALLQELDVVSERLDDMMQKVLGLYKARLEAAHRQVNTASPSARLQSAARRVSGAQELINTKIDSLLSSKRLRFSGAVGKLEAINPLAVLGRGYSVTRDLNGRVLSSVRNLSVGDGVTILLSDGSVEATVENIKYER